MQGGQGFRHALIQTENEVTKLQDQIAHLNMIIQKNDAEIDRYRGNAEQTRQDMINHEIDLRRETE